MPVFTVCLEAPAAMPRDAPGVCPGLQRSRISTMSAVGTETSEYGSFRQSLIQTNHVEADSDQQTS
eukprot:2029130-Rhodomonas_salina.1